MMLVNAGKAVVSAGLVTSMALFADGAVVSGADPLSGWGNLTALGIVAVVMIYTITKLIPGMNSQTSDTIKTIVASFASTVDKQNDRADAREKSHGEAMDRLNATLASMQAHCATVEAKRGKG